MADDRAAWQAHEPDTTCDNDVGRPCRELWPADHASWCDGCLYAWQAQEGVWRLTVLAIAWLVNEYHNDGTTRTAAETLTAIADVLGPPMEAVTPTREPLPATPAAAEPLDASLRGVE